ncbi:hypothetical protein [Micromonospora sp. NPDC004704]
MALVRAVLDPLLFGLVGLMFALPFAVVAVENEDHNVRLSEAWSGVGLTTGAKGAYRVVFIDSDNTVYDLRGQDILRAQVHMTDPDEARFLPAQPAFGLAAFGVLVGVLAGLLRRAATRMLVTAVAAFVTAGGLSVGLWLVLSRMERENGSYPPYLSYEPGAGFWLAAGLLTLLGLGNATALYRLRTGSRRRLAWLRPS